MLGHMKFFSLVLTAGLASAQISLSSSCTDSVKGLLTSPDAACMNPAALLSFVVGTERSVPNTINKWLTGLCSKGTCSDASLEAMVANVTTGCSDDLAGIGAPEDIGSTVLDIVKQVYPTARQVACLKDDSADQLCATQTLINLESIVGQLTLDDLSFFNLFADVQKLLSSGISAFACTSCTKEAFTIARENFPDVVSQVNDQAIDLCGVSFIDGNIADNVTQTATDGVFTAVVTDDQNGALMRSARLGSILGVIALGFLLVV
ncbi:hypothetical protein CPB85DRAFT_1275205 [Mucidula mucida]|nr:hypothetical protein CPB85DRAFT_1275205 [Mucidula mucida]